MSSRAFAAATLAALLCGLFFWTPQVQASDDLSTNTVGDAPNKLDASDPSKDRGVWGDLSWTDLKGRQWSAPSLLGKVVVLDFWATWCPPCLAEIPHLKKLREQHGDRLILLGVALDSLDRRRLLAFLHRQGVAWPQIHVTQGFQSEVAAHFAVESVPATRIVDPQGRLVASDLRGRALEVAVQTLMSVGDGSP